MNYNDTISVYDQGSIINPVDITSDGIETISIVGYLPTGNANNILIIGGSATDNNAIMSVKNNQLIVSGTYTSNPVKFYNSNYTFSLSQSNNNGLNNIFIVA